MVRRSAMTCDGCDELRRVRASALRTTHFALRTVIVALVALTGPALFASAPQSRRVVDEVIVGDADSERDHEHASEGAVEGVAGGRAFRQARGWQRYSLATYEDTEVTLRCTFAGTEGRPVPYELLVDGQVVATKPFASASGAPADIDITLPKTVTASKTVICVTFRAIGGATPGVIRLQTIQEHLEEPGARPAGTGQKTN